MKVTGFDPLKPAGATTKKGGASSVSGGFSSLLGLSDTEEVVATPLSNIAAPTSVTNLLSLQEVSEEEVKRKKLVQQGQNMVEVLERLRRQLLSGAISPETMQDLARNLKTQKQVVTDPGLMTLIADIELRVAVELAKLEMAAASRSTFD